jgi:hypothetical protein
VALDRLHEMLVRAALREVRRRVTLSAGGWLELADVAHQAASDEMLGILSSWSRSFPGEGRRYCRHSDVTLDCEVGTAAGPGLGWIRTHTPSPLSSSRQYAARSTAR